MWQDWWTAHRLELYVAAWAWGIALAFLLIIWIGSRRASRRAWQVLREGFREHK